MSMPCPVCGIWGAHYCPGPQLEETEHFWTDTTPRIGARIEKCLHECCTACHGSGQRRDGLGPCIHMISCPCQKCAVRITL